MENLKGKGKGKSMKVPPNIISFIEYLQSLSDDARAMAMLRRASNNHFALDAAEYIFQFLPDETDTWRNKCYLAVASLYASHKNVTDEKPFGRCLQPLASKANSKSIRKRVVVFLKSDGEGIFVYLRNLIKMLDESNPVNYGELLYGLICWDQQSKWVQLAFAKDFWKFDNIDSYKKSEEVEIKEEENLD